MPTQKTKKGRGRKPLKPSAGRRAAARKPSVARKNQPAPVRGRVVMDDGATYVLVPIEEYRRMAELPSLIATLEDPRTQWTDFDDYKLKLAGGRIAAARKAKGWTQQRLAESLNLPQSQISRIERNPDRTTVRTLKRIAAALGVDVGKLV